MARAIVLQFCSSNDPLSEAIRLYSHGWCSHVDSVLEDGRLLGARLDGGVAIRPANYEKFSRVLRLALPAPDEVVDAYYAFVRGQLGKPYDSLAIAAFAIDRDWHDPDRWFCSELVAAGLEAAGYLPQLVTPANRVTPADLLLVVSTVLNLPRRALSAA